MTERLESASSNFSIHEVPTVPPGATIAAAAPRLAPPTLGALAGLAGTFTGNGFNTIFRPQNPATPTPLPIPVPTSDNVLELNLTSETLSFSPGLGSVPNRGSLQGDVFLNGVPYVQAINDVTNPGQSTGIHFEPGIWLIVPETTAPKEGRDRRAHGLHPSWHDHRGPRNRRDERGTAKYKGRGHHSRSSLPDRGRSLSSRTARGRSGVPFQDIWSILLFLCRPRGRSP
jgi:hypothetical protein